MKKIKVLFFVTEFWNAGTQRFTFEVDQALDKEQFEVSILSFRGLNTIQGKEDYYYEKHRSLGTPIYFLNDFIETPKFVDRLSFFRKKTEAITAFLSSFDVISFMGEYSYAKIERFLNNQMRKKSVIHIMNTKFQHPKLYKNYKKENTYHFVSGFLDDEIKGELSEFKSYEHTFLPLAIKFDQSSLSWKYNNQPPQKIGIFTRLTHTKPIEYFLFSFQLLKDKHPDLELHVFGSGDPIQTGYQEIVEQLRLSDKVFFRGHTNHLKQVAIEENLSLVWFLSNYGQPGGFAGFDICSLGIPQCFWNLTNEYENDENEVFRSFNNLNDFVGYSSKILKDQSFAENVSKQQFQEIFRTRNMDEHIEKLEALYKYMASKD